MADEGEVELESLSDESPVDNFDDRQNLINHR